MKSGAHAANTHGNVSLIAGLLAVAAYNAWQAHQDQQLFWPLRSDAARSNPTLRAFPRVSILVAAWNEAKFIPHHIRSVEALSYPNKEYILCAGGTDGTFEAARRCAGTDTRVIEQAPGEGKQRALNRAFQCSTGQIIYLTDADGLVDDDSFERVLAPLIDDPAIAASSGGLRPLPEQAGNPFVFHQWSSQAYASARSPMFVRGLLGMNCAVRREILLETGALAEQVHSGTDDHLAKRIVGQGGAIRHVPASLAATSYPEHWRAYARQQSRWVRNLVIHGARFRAYDELSAAARTMSVGLAMLALPLVSLKAGSFARNAWLLALIHAVLSKRRYYRLARCLGPNPQPLPSIPRTMAYTLGEFSVWTLPLLQLLMAPWKAPAW